MSEPHTSSLDWRRLFPRRPFAHSMAIHTGNFRRFIQIDDPDRVLRDAREKLLTENPIPYVAILPDAWDIWDGMKQDYFDYLEHCQRSPTAIYPMYAPISDPSELLQNCIYHTAARDFDWVLLRADKERVYRLVGGGVCFPSGWSLPEKMNQPLSGIHSPVPGLNQALGTQIDRFLAKLSPGHSAERENWGLSADSELNHHPSLKLKKLDSNATLKNTWLRVERQILFKLPERPDPSIVWTRSLSPIVFCIRVNNFLLNDIVVEPGAAERIAHVLQTMTEDVAVYKGIGAARAALIAQLKAVKISNA